MPGEEDLCIHDPVRRLSRREWAAALRTPAFWQRVLWGTRARGHHRKLARLP
jgi:hypothetical protein